MSTPTTSNDLSKKLNQLARTTPPAIEAASTNLRQSSGASTTSGMNAQSQVPAPLATQVGTKNIEGSYAGTDTRRQAAQPVMPPQPGPRGETNDTELEGA